MAELLEVTTGQLLEDVAAREGEGEAVVYPDRDLRLSYRAFNDLCRQAARGMMAYGIEKGDHVAVWTANKPEWLVSQFATGKAGAVLVTVNTSYQQEELAYLLSQSESSTLILQPQFKTTSYIEILYNLIPELRTADPGHLQSDRFPHLKRVIIVGSEEDYPGVFSWESLLEAGDTVTNQALDERMESLDHDDVINMQYTSGTTGFPKGVMLTHSNIVNNGLNIAECMELTSEDRLCIPVPFFHCFGCVLGTLACVNKGTTMVIVEEFDPKLVMEAVHQERCTGLHGVPTMFIAELNHPDFDQYNFSSLRTGIMAGSNCPVEVMKAVMEKMGANEVTIAYGQTESSPVITQTRTHDTLERKTETVGRALPHVEAKIVDPNTGKEVPAGTQGELCTRGYHVMKGYYNDPAATEEVLTDDGWLHTGDLAVMDEYGYCAITGRIKDMIIRGGENIFPREIEEFLYRHPAILDVQVVGVPEPKYGEEIGAYVRVKEDQETTAEEIKEFCRGSISHQKIPRYITFVDSYPMTASGKVQKYKLREQAKEIFSRP
ncbi:fatty-acyl-CoA synthase [Geomicrobium halophilum]|uniref:Fatty-acyl-CoA synthase n=1 Tax=Geomicrobium halophilum TaxID=549000 RepID=A0A841Q2S7_9BACL|nr:AMP-binding protein [Geomicrobium halophilum]MBB6451348.1 fatty-acyl-CoA synthase [Geomicrobium halophilum]